MKYIAEMFERYHRSGDTSFAGGLVYEASKEWDAYIAKHPIETEEVPEPEPGQIIATSDVNIPFSTSQTHGQVLDYAAEKDARKAIKERDKAEAPAKTVNVNVGGGGEWTVAGLKDELRGRGLAVSGTKNELLERVYEDSTVAELKDELRAEDLPVTGTKDELVDRLEDDAETGS